MSLPLTRPPVQGSAICAGLALFLSIGTLTMATSTPAQVETASAPKGMRVVASDSAALDVDIEPLRESYRVDEPIRFRVRGNEAFYVYLYNVDEESGESLLIYPNEIEQDNFFPAGRSFLIPNRAAEFYADRAGREQVLMIASTGDLDVPYDRDRTDRHFYSASAADIEGLLSAQGIRVDGDDGDRQAEDLVVKRLELEVTGEDYEAGPVTEYPTALVSTARDHYRVGEGFDVVFGADRDGWVHLYAVEPRGAYDRLTRRAVRGGALESLSVRAETPYGWHKLVAVYTPEQRLDRGVEGAILGDGKRIETPNDPELAVAVRRLLVLR